MDLPSYPGARRPWTIFEGQTKNHSPLTKWVGEHMLNQLNDSESQVIKFDGFNGIGRWRVAEYAAKIAMEESRFDVLIWVKLSIKELSPWKVQMKIAESLGIHSPMSVGDMREPIDLDMEAAHRIYEMLKNRKFLLVMGDMSEPIDLEAIGIPNTRRRRTWRSSAISEAFSKVVLIVKERIKDIPCDYNLYFLLTFAGKVPPEEAIKVWDLFCEEFAEAARSPSTGGYFTPEVVMDCLMYHLLVQEFYNPMQGEWMVRYWIVEGFIGGEKEEILMADRVTPLLRELEDRSFLSFENSKCELSDEVFDVARQILRLSEEGKVPACHYRFWINKDSLPKEDDEHGWGATQKMSLFMGREININLPPSPKCPNLSTLMLQCDVERLDLSVPPTFFNHMEGLRVLNFYDAPIKSLPFSLSSLCNLRLLRLQNCKKLESLPTSFKALEKLEFLDLSNCSSLKTIPEESFELMNNLRLLHLSEAKILSLPSSVSNLHNLQQLVLNNCKALTDIPENCFERMQHLQVLKFAFAASLKSLPSSLSKLVSLKTLDLSICFSLKKGAGPTSLQNLSSLEVLDLRHCKALVEDMRDDSFEVSLPNLKCIDLCFINRLKRVSLRGCRSLEQVELGNLQNLEQLDLSGTKIKKLPLEPNFLMTSLRRLDILPMKYIHRLNSAGNIDLQPRELNWDKPRIMNLPAIDVEQFKFKHGVGACIWVSDDYFFGSLSSSSSLFKAKCFSRFYIRISRCEDDKEEKQGICVATGRKIDLNRNQFSYKSIYAQTQTHRFLHIAKTWERHLEILGGKSSQLGIRGILKHTDCLTVCDNKFIEILSDLGLKECWIGRCQSEKSIFRISSDFAILNGLEILWLSDLPMLSTVCEGLYGRGSFALLKHMYLEGCPKLVTMFTSLVYLESLETLEIKFCSRLEDVFGEEVSIEGTLKSLRSLCLWQLPKLKSICNVHLPNLQKVRVRGCGRLKKLPIRVRIVKEGDQDATSVLPLVEIEGELHWWNNLQLIDDSDAVKRPARFRPWIPLITRAMHQH